MLDNLLRFGASFDWISPMLTIAQNLANGPSDTLLIPQDCGWTGGQVASLLRRHGIHTWGHMVVNGTLMINVRQAQARWARYLLQRAGLGLDGCPGGTPRPAADRPGALHGLGDTLKEIGELRIL